MYRRFRLSGMRMKPRTCWLWLDPPNPNDGTNIRSKAAPTVARSRIVRQLGADVGSGAGDLERPIVEIGDAAAERQAGAAAQPVAERAPRILERDLVRAFIQVREANAVLGPGRRPGRSGAG